MLLLDADGITLRGGAAPSLPEEYRRAADGIRIGPCAGSCGTAVYRKQPVVVSDISTDPLWAEYRHLALPHGLRACWSTPIANQEGAILGTFAVYYREPRTPDPQHFRIIAHATRIWPASPSSTTGQRFNCAPRKTRYRTLVERLPAITYICGTGRRRTLVHYVSPPD